MTNYEDGINKTVVAVCSNTTLFNKEELATILKFGAAELFSQEDGDDDEQEVDIDEVFKYAETRDTNASGEASEELLSQFKVVSFDNLEEETNDINMDRSPGMFTVSRYAPDRVFQ